MLELKKLCKEFENLSTVERTACLADCSLRVLGKLTTLDIPGVDPVGSLVSFILGATVADGELDEKEYLLIYPPRLCTRSAQTSTLHPSRNLSKRTRTGARWLSNTRKTLSRCFR